MTFNNGKPYSGSEEMKGGGLIGTTDTDYFYFFCPFCRNRHIMRVLEYGFHEGPKPAEKYPDILPKQTHDFTIVLKLYCQECKHTDFVKISNIGWQEGKLPE